MEKSVKRRILHFFFPNRCPVCGKVIYANDSFCEECAAKLKPFTENFIIDGADGFTAVFEYEDEIKPSVILMKNGILGNSAYALGKALGEKLKANGTAEKLDMIIPVPMFSKDERERGYNQSVIICREIADVIGKTVRTDIIIKAQRTAHQKNLSRTERQQNLKGVFTVVDPEAVKGRNILIADDVCTTGSTLAELTKILIEAGAEKVYCASCCKTTKETSKK